MMAKVKASGSSNPIRDIPPALTPESSEKQMVALATDLARKQLLEGTASSQVIVHYLKIGSTEKQLELEKLRQETILIKAKAEAQETAKNVEKLYAEAIAAMKQYGGHGGSNED